MDGTLVRIAPLSRSFNKSQFLLGICINHLFQSYNVTNILFITLTFADGLRSVREAQRRLNSFLNKVRQRYGAYLWALQPQGSGVIHFHLLIPVGFNAHVGTNLDAWSFRNEYTDEQRREAMSAPLRTESDWWETKAPGFGFGRVEVAPVYSNGEAIRKYLTRQDWRTWHWPFEETKNVRFWGCSTNVRCGNVKFSWNTVGGQNCRARLRDWAQQQGCQSYEELTTKLGKHWGYQYHHYLTQLRNQAH